MEKKQYLLTFKMWEDMGCPDFEIDGVEVIDQTDEGFLLEGFWSDGDNDGIPDYLEERAGGDVILTPSGEVVIG